MIYELCLNKNVFKKQKKVLFSLRCSTLYVRNCFCVCICVYDPELFILLNCMTGLYLLLISHCFNGCSFIISLNTGYLALFFSSRLSY